MGIGHLHSSTTVRMFRVISMDAPVLKMDLSTVVVTSARGLGMAVLMQSSHLHHQQ